MDVTLDVTSNTHFGQFSDRFLAFVNHHYRILLILGFIVAISVRIYNFPQVPGGVEKDEAMIGYEAWSILTTGHDQFGYVSPVYFTAWGGGCSALLSYLLIPFLAIFGNTEFSVRIVTLILSLLSLGIFYSLVKLIENRFFSLAALYLLAINPWHIIQSRRALDCNLLAFFLLLAVLFLVKSRRSSIWAVPASLSLGLCLYCYALGWIIVPFFILLLLVFGQSFGFNYRNPFWLLGGCILFVLAAPLILFVLINLGYLEEIKTGWISIPRLPGFRGGEFSLLQMPSHLKYFLFDILIRQNDGLLTNQVQGYGMFYLFSMPFILLGIACESRQFINRLKTHALIDADLILVWLLASLVLIPFIPANINNLNASWYPCIFFCALGWKCLVQLDSPKIILYGIIAYTLSFSSFCYDYFSTYPQLAAISFSQSAPQALEYAASITDGPVTVTTKISYSLILFYQKVPPDEYQQTVKYKGSIQSFFLPKSFSRYVIGLPDQNNIQTDQVYIVEQGKQDYFEAAGLSITDFGQFVVAYPPIISQ